MSGDWIKARADLFTHPKVMRMASALKADNLRTVGGLMSAWCLFDAHSTDGKLPGYTSKTLDDFLRWPGFSAAMIAVDWLAEDQETLLMPRFETHNGKSAKRRAQDADRKKDSRKASASDADNLRTREEKRREEKNKSKEKSKEVARASRLPADWRPDPELRVWAKAARPDIDLPNEIENFRDYWQARAGPGAVKVDWRKTFQVWIRRTREENHGRVNGTPRLSAVERVEHNIRRARAERGEA